MGKFGLLVIVFLLAGCGNLQSALSNLRGAAGPSFSSSAAIEAALDKAGLTCSSYKAVQKDDRDFAEQGAAADVGRCDVEGEDVHLVTFKDGGQLDNWAGATKQLGCGIGKAFGISNMNYVRGGTWAVSGASQTLADKVSGAVGGTAVHVDCADVKIPGS